VASALVGPDAATALLTSLQTAPSLRGGRLPRSDDEDGEVDSGPYRLRGWLTEETSYGGIDKRDPLADSIEYPVSRPADWICGVTQVRPNIDGLAWLDTNEEVAVATETWAMKDGGRDARGPQGTRLRVSPDFLAKLANKAEAGVIVEVQIRRRPARGAYSNTPDYEELRYIDDYVRYFLYAPDDGWRDYLGRHIAWSEDR